jgi:pyridoxamine 5'-phosphate oxidase family protein
MSVFSAAEISYLQSQRLARIATAGPDCQPHVVPLAFRLASIEPWRPRMIEVRGEADILPTGGESVGRGFDPPTFRIRPKRIISIGIEGDGPFGRSARSVG